MKQEVQIYALLSALIPTESAQLEYRGFFVDEDERILLDNDMNCYKAFLKSIEEEGMKYAITIDIYGKILDGNCRYHCAIKLGWMVVPVTIVYFIGQDMAIPKILVK